MSRQKDKIISQSPSTLGKHPSENTPSLCKQPGAPELATEVYVISVDGVCRRRLTHSPEFVDTFRARRLFR